MIASLLGFPKDRLEIGRPACAPGGTKPTGERVQHVSELPRIDPHEKLPRDIITREIAPHLDVLSLVNLRATNSAYHKLFTSDGPATQRIAAQKNRKWCEEHERITNKLEARIVALVSDKSLPAARLVPAVDEQIAALAEAFSLSEMPPVDGSNPQSRLHYDINSRLCMQKLFLAEQSEMLVPYAMCSASIASVVAAAGVEAALSGRLAVTTLGALTSIRLGAAGAAIAEANVTAAESHLPSVEDLGPATYVLGAAAIGAASHAYINWRAAREIARQNGKYSQILRQGIVSTLPPLAYPYAV